MKRNKKTCKVGGSSLIRQLSIESIRIAILKSKSYSEALRILGLDVKTVYINTIKEIIEVNNIEISHFVKDFSETRCKFNKPNILFPALNQNSKLDINTIKRGIRHFKLIAYKCGKCPVIDEYNGAKISLQLDHINGINNDNRLENLRWLCPNCHSQTETFAGRNTRIFYELKYCGCGLPISRKNITGKCSQCRDYVEASNKNPIAKKFEVSKVELENLIKEKPMIEIGRMFGVSDTAVKKRCKKLGIELFHLWAIYPA